MSDPREILRKAADELRADRGIALCAILRTRGSTPQPAGVIVAVDESGRMEGSLGGGCVEAAIRRAAHEMVLRRSSGLLTYELDHDFGYDDGMICGGTLEVGVQSLHGRSAAAELGQIVAELNGGDSPVLPLRVAANGQFEEYRIRLEAVPKLIIAGAGHITRCLAPLAGQLGFAVAVIDDRTEYADAARFSPPIRTAVGDIGTTLRNWPIDPHTYVVILTRGHKHDEAAVAAVLPSPARYIGMIGSTRKVNVVMDDLRHIGFNEAQLARLHAPIGIPIGAKTPEEIAVSIAAELVKIRRSAVPCLVEGPFDGGPI